MRADGALGVAMLTATVLWATRTAAARSSAIKLCGPRLSETMSHICRSYNSPGDLSPDQPTRILRRKRDMGIVEECCYKACTWTQLKQYCADSTVYVSISAESLEPHMIADRSAEVGVARPGPKSEAISSVPIAVGASRRREVGRARSRGYGRSRVAGRRCRCRRRRAGRRRSILMGNMGLVKDAARAAPVVGTVSPLLMWGRTMHADLRTGDRDRLAYVTV